MNDPSDVHVRMHPPPHTLSDLMEMLSMGCTRTHVHDKSRVYGFLSQQYFLLQFKSTRLLVAPVVCWWRWRHAREISRKFTERQRSREKTHWQERGTRNTPLDTCMRKTHAARSAHSRSIRSRLRLGTLLEGLTCTNLLNYHTCYVCSLYTSQLIELLNFVAEYPSATGQLLVSTPV